MFSRLCAAFAVLRPVSRVMTSGKVAVQEVSNHVERTNRTRMIDNATIAAYNSDSKHRITRAARWAASRQAGSLDISNRETLMSDPTKKPPTTVDTTESFIPESVDQLLAHSRRYPLLTPEQEIDLAQRSEERRVGKECRSRWSPDH